MAENVAAIQAPGGEDNALTACEKVYFSTSLDLDNFEVLNSIKKDKLITHSDILAYIESDNRDNYHVCNDSQLSYQNGYNTIAGYENYNSGDTEKCFEDADRVANFILDLRWMLHELEHVQQCNAVGGLYSYVNKVWSGYTSAVINQSFKRDIYRRELPDFDVHDHASFEEDADSKAEIILPKIIKDIRDKYLPSRSVVDSSPIIVWNSLPGLPDLQLHNEAGLACFYTEAYGEGHSQCLPSGLYKKLSSQEHHTHLLVNNSISSMKIYGDIHVIVCSEENFGGYCESYDSNAEFAVGLTAPVWSESDNELMNNSIKSFKIFDLDQIKDLYKSIYLREPSDAETNESIQALDDGLNIEDFILKKAIREGYKDSSYEPKDSDLEYAKKRILIERKSITDIMKNRLSAIISIIVN